MVDGVKTWVRVGLVGSIFVLLGVLAACGDLSGGGDPNAAKAGAQQTIDAANRNLYSTEVARQQAQEQAAVQAAQTKGAAEIELTQIAAHAAETRTAFDLQMQIASATTEAKRSFDATQAAAPGATQTAEANYRTNLKESRDFWWDYNFWTPFKQLAPLLALIIGGLFALVVVILFTWKVAPRIVKMGERLALAYEDRQRTTDHEEYIYRQGENVFIVKPNRNFSGALEITPAGVRSAPTAPDTESQKHQNGLEAAVEMTRAFPQQPAARNEVRRMTTDLLVNGGSLALQPVRQQPMYRIVGPTETPPQLAADPNLLPILEGDYKKEVSQ